MAEDIVRDPAQTTETLMNILENDRDQRLLLIDDYLRGAHRKPYMPDNADAEYKLLADRCITNHMPLLVNSIAQVLCVDGYRRGSSVSGQAGSMHERTNLPEWDHWENSRLQSRQNAVHRAAVGYGHSFTLTEFVNGTEMTRGLSPLTTTAIYEDPANDDNPIAAIHVQRWPQWTEDSEDDGLIWMWDRTYRYEMVLRNGEFVVKDFVDHGTRGECPITRFSAEVDLDGRTVGILEPYLSVQDRINQTVFDLLVAQTGASFRTRWVTGMAPPMRMVPQFDENGNIDPMAPPVPELDENGNPIPLPFNLNAKKFLMAEDSDARFGDLPATDLDPYISALTQAIKDLSSLSQTPPHYMLGQIANLSADAMKAAESGLTRKASNFKMVFGESWERVFRLALRLSNNAAADDMTGEVIWRDLEAQSLAQAADAYGKFAESLQIPPRALWDRLPGISQSDILRFEQYADEAGDLGGMSKSPADVASMIEEDDNGEEFTDEGSAGSG